MQYFGIRFPRIERGGGEERGEKRGGAGKPGLRPLGSFLNPQHLFSIDLVKINKHNDKTDGQCRVCHRRRWLWMEAPPVRQTPDFAVRSPTQEPSMLTLLSSTLCLHKFCPKWYLFYYLILTLTWLFYMLSLFI